MKYLLNYANLKFFTSQRKQTDSALAVGNFDHVFQCSFNDIDKDFYIRNKKILDQPKGAGYWLWKPYLILKHLKNLNEKDFLFYLDSGAFFIDRIDPLEKICRERTPGLLCFHMSPDQKEDCIQTKRDVYVVMGCDNENFWFNKYSVSAGINGWIKNKFTIDFLEEWLYYAQKDDIITDNPNKFGPNLPGFRFNRHDQSIFSVLRKKYNIPSFTDPSQFGNSYRNSSSFEYDNWCGDYIPLTINLHRMGN